MAGLYTEEEALRIRHENYEKTQAFNEWQSMMLAQARPDRAAPILLSYCLPFVCRLSGEALPPLLPPVFGDCKPHAVMENTIAAHTIADKTFFFM